MTADKTDKKRIRKQVECMLVQTKEMTDGLTTRIEDLETEREEMINARAYYMRKASVLRTILIHDMTDVHEEWWHEIPSMMKRLEKDRGKIQ